MCNCTYKYIQVIDTTLYYTNSYMYMPYKAPKVYSPIFTN